MKPSTLTPDTQKRKDKFETDQCCTKANFQPRTRHPLAVPQGVDGVDISDSKELVILAFVD
jgi:hypothetical protein